MARKTKSKSKSNVAPTEELYGEFQQAFDYFNGRLFGGILPHCLITLKVKPRSKGHYAHGRFVALADSETRTDEIAMNPTLFAQRTVKETLSTLVHEMVHLEQQHYGKPAKGSHHNKEWGDLMKAQGLYPSSTGEPGGKETGNKVSHYIIPGGAFDCAAEDLLTTGFKLSWGDAGDFDKKGPSKQGRRAKYVCPGCAQAAWAKHGAKLICGACYEAEDTLIPMVAEGSEPEGSEPEGVDSSHVPF